MRVNFTSFCPDAHRRTLTYSRYATPLLRSVLMCLLISLVTAALAQDRGPQLKFSLEVNRVLVDQSETKEQFVLTFENTGKDAYPVATQVEQIWRVSLYQKEAAVAAEFLTWSDKGPGITSIKTGEKHTVMAEWQFPNIIQAGTYHFEAQFLPTGDRETADFTIWPPMDREILFTGKLMGYYRLPNQQLFARSASDPPCTVPGPGHQESRDATVFIEKYRQRSLDTLLVGTGDNFAPNYYSRVLYGATNDDGSSPPAKELYSWEGKNWLWYEDIRRKSPDTHAQLQQGISTIPTDNVGCFLSYVHYDAIVPGKHDFYYGTERLRQLARFMASIEQKDKDFWPVQMLAANLMIKTSWAKDHTPIPDSGKPPLPFLAKYSQIPLPPQIGKNQRSLPVDIPYRNLEIVDFTNGGFAFPWMQFIRIDAKGSWPQTDFKKLLEVYLCEAQTDDPDDFLNHGGFCNNQHPLHLSDRATMAAQGDVAKGTVPLVYDLPEAAPLQPGRNYAVCIRPPEITVDLRNDEEARHGKPYCFRFSVYNPFFQFPNWQDRGHNDPAGRYKNPGLWALREGDGKTPVVIFGVVDPQLEEHVGGDNFAWRTVRGALGGAEPDNRFTTKLEIADPVLTLIHLQDYFEKQYGEEHANAEFHGIRVLLAQMPPEEVKQLAEHLPRCLRFDVIVSAADDALATHNQVLQLHPTAVDESQVCHGGEGTSGLKMRSSRVVNETLATPATFIAVPPSHERSAALPARHQPDEQESRFLQVRELRISADSRPNLTYALDGDPLPVRLPDKTTFVGMANSFWRDVCRSVYGAAGTNECLPKDEDLNKQMTPNRESVRMLTTRNPGTTTTIPWDDDVKKRAIQQLALWSMREQYHTDVALLQERDFYPGGLDDYLAEHCVILPSQRLQCDPSLPDTKEILDRIIWKGDYIQVKSVQGSVLKNVLKQSDQFSKTEKTPYASPGESGRPLVKLGIQPDGKNGGDYLINGRPLDSTAVYTVATSDYIGLGDTGYPDLVTPPVGDPDPAASATEPIITVSGRTCETLVRVQELPSTSCHGKLNREGYYDELTNRTPDDVRKGNTSWHKFYAWTFLHGELGQPSPKSKGQAPPGPEDIAAQMQKRVDAEKNWDFSLDKASIGFSALTHTDNEQTLSREFGGVQNAQVNAKHSHSWDWDANSKFTLFHPKFDEFVSEGLQYSSSFTSQISGPRSETQSRNQFAVDGGTYLHPWATNKQLPQWSAVVAGHFETSVANPLTNINLNAVPPSASPSTLIFPQGRTRLLLGRTGARFQDRKSYIEAGLEGGETLNAIEQFHVLTAPGGPAVTCFLQASVSLSKCLNTFNQNNPLTPVTPNSNVSVIRRHQERYGVYWSIGLTVPVNPTISYNFQDSSDYFFNSPLDNSADTRFRHQLVNSLKFTVFPNLSFEPTYTIFLYENKLDYHFLLQQQYTVKINYSFDWSNWHESKQQLRYKKPSPQ